MEVCGDPVGSTDPEVSRIIIPAPMRCVKRPLHAILAFNARLMLVSGVERQLHACFWCSAPALCSVLALNASQMLLTGI